MIAQINAVIRKDKRLANGLVPIYIKVLSNGERKFVRTGQFLEDKYWNTKNESVSDKHHDYKNMNMAISGLKTKLYKEYNNQLVSDDITPISAAEVVINATAAGKGKPNLFTTVEGVIAERKAKPDDFSAKTLKNYTKILNRLDAYYMSLDKNHKTKGLLFADITPDFLEKYNQALRAEGLSGNYINGIFRMIRTFLKLGIKKEVITYDPFIAFEIPKGKRVEKEYLTLDELKAFEELIPQLQGVQKQAIVYFLFGCYSGLRVSDWFKFNAKRHLGNEGLQLATTKTDTYMFVPYYPELNYILKLVKETPLTTKDVLINRELKLICAELEWTKKLSTHCARKTFAVTMCANNEISCEVCAEMMGITVKVCMENYYRVTKNRIKGEVKRGLIEKTHTKIPIEAI